MYVLYAVAAINVNNLPAVIKAIIHVRLVGFSVPYHELFHVVIFRNAATLCVRFVVQIVHFLTLNGKLSLQEQEQRLKQTDQTVLNYTNKSVSE